MRSPLRAVLEQFAAGARSLDEIGERTGLRQDLVRAIVDRLVRTGHIRAETLSADCPAQGCGTCPVNRGCAIKQVTPPPPREGGLVGLSLSKDRRPGLPGRRPG